MSEFEVRQPIICSPFEEPAQHWHIEEGVPPEAPTPGRRPAQYFYRPPGGDTQDGAPAGVAVPLPLVNVIRRRIKEWRESAYAERPRRRSSCCSTGAATAGCSGRSSPSSKPPRRSCSSPRRGAISCRASTFRSTSRASPRKPTKDTGPFRASHARWRPARARPPSWGCSPPGASSTKSVTDPAPATPTSSSSSAPTSRFEVVSESSIRSSARPASIDGPIWFRRTLSPTSLRATSSSPTGTCSSRRRRRRAASARAC